jgi:hypothetical protein
LTGAPVGGGPTITHVYQVSARVYTLTITHDIGTDIVVPAGAANGNGFAVMDGGSLSGTPGTIINAVSCAYVDATHIQITLASTPANSASSLHLYYPFGNLPASGSSPAWGGATSNRIGVGNAVTDNAQSVMNADASSISNQLASSWGLNFPLATPPYGLAVSTTPT